MASPHALHNFQVPVADFDRALKFYNEVLGYELQTMEFGGSRLAVFRFDNEKGGVGGTLIKSEGLEPSTSGTMVYLDAGEDMQPMLDRVEPAGGKVYVPKTPLGPDMGFFAIFDDTEGNRVGFYSRK